MEKVFQKIETGALYTILAIIPLAALPISPNPYIVTKLAITTMLLAVYLLAKALKTIASGKLTWSVSAFDLGAFLLAGVYVASTIIATPNKMEAILLPGTATVMISGALLYFGLNQLKTEQKKFAQMILSISGALFAVMSIASFVGIFEAFSGLPAYMKARSFTPEGGYLPAALFLGVGVALAFDLLLASENFVHKIVGSVTAVIMFLGLGLSVFNMLPGKATAVKLPSTQVSWSVAVDALKESPVIGIGPGNYASAFSLYRPRTYNASDLWAVKFSTARNFFLTVMTETGLVGLTALVLVTLVIYRGMRKKMQSDEGFITEGGLKHVSLAALLVVGFIYPFSQLVIYTFFILMALSAKAKKGTLNLSLSSSKDEQPLASRIPAIIITIPFFLVVGYYFVYAPRIIRAEYRFAQGIIALSENKARDTFDYMAQAINTNPRVDRYHMTFSRVNLLLAQSLVQQEGEMTEERRNDIGRLVQQAISEARAGVSLNPLRASNWENLARTYQSVIPLANGASQFAIQSYRQAIVLDPYNPNLRIALGNLYYSLGEYDTAVNTLELAIAAKPDLANSYFNIAFALSERGNEGDIDAAITAMTTVLSLVDEGTQDYEVARKALETLQEKKSLSAETVEGTDELNPPAPQEEPALDPQLDLPEGSEPPEAPETPATEDEDEGNADTETSVTPSVTTTVTTTPSPTPEP